MQEYFLMLQKVFFRIYEDRGIALLHKISGATNIVNSTSKVLRICLVGGSTVSSKDLEVGGAINISNNIVTIAFWSAKS